MMTSHGKLIEKKRVLRSNQILAVEINIIAVMYASSILHRRKPDRQENLELTFGRERMEMHYNRKIVWRLTKNRMQTQIENDYGNIV